jgi:hypothetical protein
MDTKKAISKVQLCSFFFFSPSLFAAFLLSTFMCFLKIDHYLVVAEVSVRLSVSKETMHKLHMERFSLKKLNKTKGKEQYWVEILNRFTALENLDDDMDIYRAWGNYQREYQHFS